MNEKPNFRSVVFGMNSIGEIRMVGKFPETEEDLGLYVHCEDIKKFELWSKQFDTPRNDEQK